MQVSLFKAAAIRMSEAKIDTIKMRHEWFGSDEEAVSVYNSILDGIRGMVSKDIATLMYGALWTGWLMKEIQNERQIKT